MPPQTQVNTATPKVRPGKVRPGRVPGRKSKLAAAAAGPSPMVQRAQAELDPVIAAITQSANDRAARAEAAIKGLTDSYAQQIAGVDYGAPYAGAEQGQAAVDAALEQALTGQGSDLASGLSGRLAALAGSSGAGAVDQAAGALASQGASAGTTRLASGSASLGDLIAQEAAAREYGTKMPGVAKLSGVQGVRQAEGNAQGEIASGTLQLEGKLPDLVEQLKSDRRASIGLKLQKQSAAAERAYKAAELGQAQQRLGIEGFRARTSARQGDQRLAIEEQSVQNTAVHDRALERMAQANYGLSAERLVLAQQKAVQARKSGGLTANEVGSMRQKAAGDLQDFYHGVAAKYQLGPDGSRQLVAGTGPGSAKKYQDAIKSLMLSYPALGPKQIIGMANQLYRPGEGGRPLKATGIGPGFFDKLAKAAARPFDQGLGGAVESATAQTIVGLAQKFQGTPYVWGGESPKGFDCSGFAQYLYSHAGVSIPRTTYTQWTAPNGHSIPRGQLLPGDLVFFRGSDSVGGLPGHVGIYIGGGKMIDAPHTGASVRTESVDSFGGYMGARRYTKG